MKKNTIIYLGLALSSFAHAELPSFQEIVCQNTEATKVLHAKITSVDKSASGLVEAGTMVGFMKNSYAFKNKPTSEAVFENLKFNFEVSNNAIYGTLPDSSNTGVKIYSNSGDLKIDLESKNVFGKVKTETLSCSVFK